VSTKYLIDMSAWARLGSPFIEQSRADELADAMAGGYIHACPPFLLELGMTARNHSDYEEIMSLAGDAMPYVGLDDEIARSALAIHDHLARTSHHRVKLVDLLIAAAAARHDLTVLHMDKHYEIISERGGISFGQEWLAPADLFGGESGVQA